MQAAPIPVSVLTGALGAGKTTLLNALLKGGALPETAVVVNEFGAVGIDNLLIESSSEEVVLLLAAACCQGAFTSPGAAAPGAWRAPRQLPAFRRVVVETSGRAEPARSCKVRRPPPLRGLPARRAGHAGRRTPGAQALQAEGTLLPDAARDRLPICK
jgi:G3E family GTPase